VSEQRTHTGLSVKTLLIAAAASGVAAIVIPMLWRPGTVFAAAASPIVVALVSEALRRPVDTVSGVRVRRTERGTALLDPPPADPAEPFDPLAPASAEDLASLPRATGGQRAVHRRRPLTARQWKLGLVTGLVAFAVAAGVVTASELVAGDAVSRGSGRTTFFGGSTASDGRQKPADQTQHKKDKTKQQATPTPTPTPTMTGTPSPSPSATPTPTPTVTPAPTPDPGLAPPAEPTPVP
jgi:hypothetical protein